LLVLVTEFQPMKSLGSDVSPSCASGALEFTQPPTLVDASTSTPLMIPSLLVSSIFPAPWLIGLFRSVNVIAPSF
jgi:hypothetical protein